MAPIKPWTKLEDNYHFIVFFNVVPKSLTLAFKFKTEESEEAIALDNCEKAFCPSGPAFDSELYKSVKLVLD